MISLIVCKVGGSDEILVEENQRTRFSRSIGAAQGTHSSLQYGTSPHP